MDYYLITNKRHKLAHIAGPHDKPLCSADTKRTFVRTLLYHGMKLCPPCTNVRRAGGW